MLRHQHNDGTCLVGNDGICRIYVSTYDQVEGPIMAPQRLVLPGTGTYVEIRQAIHEHPFGTMGEYLPSLCWHVEHGGVRTGHQGSWGRCNAAEASKVAATAAVWQSNADGRRSAQIARLAAERAAGITR